MSVAIPEKVDLSKYIEMRDGRANIRGRRLPVAYIISTQRAQNSTIEELAYSYTLSEEQVLAALLYYRENQADVDAKFAEDVRESEEMHRKYGGMPGRRS
jgi:uncharacterized protein (DUF433 family)